MKKLAINPSNKKYYSDDYIKGWENGVKAQYEATIDSVEVVRCGECQYMRADGKCVAFADDVIRPSVSDFCSYGKRRGGDPE